MFRSHLGIIAIVLLLSACGATRPPLRSGFLGDESVYRDMQPDNEAEGVEIVRYDSANKLRGGAFILPPVKVYLNHDGQKREIPQSELSELAIHFHNKLYSELSEKYQLTHVPGPGTYLLRLAITDADPAVSEGTGDKARKEISGLGGATVEMAIEDSTTGELIIAAAASREGHREEADTKWGPTEEVLTDFAKLIRLRLDEINAGRVNR